MAHPPVSEPHERPAATPLPTPSPQRLSLAKDAYAELDRSAAALERKVGQLLVSSTFFVTAAAALLAVDDVRSFVFVFNRNAMVPLPLLHLVVFLVLTSVGVVHLTMALGLSLKPRRPDASGDLSYLAWWSMIQKPKNEWQSLFTRSEDSYDEYRLTQLLEVTRYAARMANYTYERLVEGRAYFFTAVTTFIAATPSLTIALTAGGSSRAWSLAPAAWQASATSLLLFVSMNDRFRLESDVDTINDSTRPTSQFKILAWIAPISSGFAILASVGSWPFILLHVVSMCALSAMLSFEKKSPRLRTVYDRVHPAVLLVVAAIGIMLFTLPTLRPWLLLYAFWPMLVSEGIRLLDNRLYRTNIKKRHV